MIFEYSIQKIQAYFISFSIRFKPLTRIMIRAYKNTDIKEVHYKQVPFLAAQARQASNTVDYSKI